MGQLRDFLGDNVLNIGCILVVIMLVIGCAYYAQQNPWVPPEVEVEQPMTDYEKVQSEIIADFATMEELGYLHTRAVGEIEYYDISLQGMTYDSVKASIVDYITFIDYISESIKVAWANNGFTSSVVVSLVDADNHEQVLITSKDGSNTFNTYDNQLKYLTEEDWLTYFDYVYDRLPKSNKELQQFKKSKGV